MFKEATLMVKVSAYFVLFLLSVVVILSNAVEAQINVSEPTKIVLTQSIHHWHQ